MSGQPPTHLLDLVPDAEALLLLQPEEIGELLVEVIHAGPDWGGGGLTAAHAATEANRYPPQHREALREAIVEAWSWLENAGLISRYKPGEGDPNQCFVTRRARSMRTCADVALYRKAGLLPQELLHPKLVEKVWTPFIRGDYETAVFQAFKEDLLRRAACWGRVGAAFPPIPDAGASLMTDARVFRGFRFPAEVILWAVRWYLQFPISYRDLERMLADRGVAVDHTTLYRWVQRFAPELEKRLRRHLRPCRGSWHVDETYVRVGGQWRYLYRAVDGTGQTIDFLLRAKRDKQAARRFFRQALGRETTRNPREIVTDRLTSYPGALRAMKREGELWRFTRHRRGRWLNNLIEQDHRRIKRRTRPMLGFGSFRTARRALAGVEAMAMLAKGQVRAAPRDDMPAQRAFVHQVFGLAA